MLGDLTIRPEGRVTWYNETTEAYVDSLSVFIPSVEIKTGDRLAQGVVMPFVRVELEDGDGATAPSRGGFGSTG